MDSVFFTQIFFENFGKLKTEWLKEHAASGNEQIKAVNDLKIESGIL